MTLQRLAPWLIAALVSGGVALWLTADASSSPADDAPAETKAFDQLAAVAAAHGHTIPDGLASYAHAGDAVIAYAPLDGIAGYTAAELQAGALIVAIVIAEPTPGRVPNGAYVVQVKLAANGETGVATYFDARGVAAARVPAHATSEITTMFPGASDLPPPSSVPRITSIRVGHDHHYAIDCAGWQPYRVIYY